MKAIVLLSIVLIAGCASTLISKSHTDCDNKNECVVVIMNKLSSNWFRPKSLADDQEKLRDLEVIIFVKLNELYGIERASIRQSSSNEEFDDSVIRAVALSAPFLELSGLPMEEYNRSFKNLKLTFRPEDLIK
ncbi:hypothetical protein AAOGI_07780 [Agarivorans albus]